MIFQDKSFGERPEIRDKKTEMAKLEENVNFQMYFKDYWNIRWGKGLLFVKKLRDFQRFFSSQKVINKTPSFPVNFCCVNC